jgi:hypothetical protein
VVQETTTLTTLTVPTVPTPFITVQICEGLSGWDWIVTA